MFSGQETQEYADDAKNFAMYSASTILDIDPSIRELLGTPAPVAFERDASGKFVEVEDLKDIGHLGGETLSADDLKRVEAETGLNLPTSFALLLTSQPLVGLTFLLDDNTDESGLGAEFKWMTADQMIDEATEAYPGIAAVPRGFLPVGVCLEGSGDPYFLRLEDGAVVRIPHDAVIDEDLDIGQVERVVSSVDHLIESADISGPTVDDG